jgi:pantoate--beta-alanine ligase
MVGTIAEVRRELDAARTAGATVGLVPTMGYLHDGHGSLFRRARSACDVVVASIFVNPLQFGANEDLSTYPRDLDRDRALAEREGVDLLLVPSVEEMYPSPVLTSVSVAEIPDRLEGASRPGHFTGVATVVAKLLNIFGPDRAYFGDKDWQQVAVIRRMVDDLSFPVEIVACPTVREPDGLAMASRNAYLTADERAVAPTLHRALAAGADAVTAGERSPAAVEKVMADVVATVPAFELDYAVAVDAATLAPVDPLAGDVRLLIAARLGRPRLIDNLGVRAE